MNYYTLFLYRMIKQTVEHYSEATIQQLVVRYLRSVYPSALHCASAGGVHTSYKQAKKMVATGYVKGFPDLFIYEARGNYHGLAIELKTHKGSTSLHQRAWIQELTNRGYKAVVCKGYDSALQTIDSYFKGEQ